MPLTTWGIALARNAPPKKYEMRCNQFMLLLPLNH
jgi:hypothetical protein